MTHDDMKWLDDLPCARCGERIGDDDHFGGCPNDETPPAGGGLP